MAISKNFFSLRTGSTKSSTFKTLKGQQLTLDRMGKPKNPQTERQLWTRMKLAVVSRHYSLLKGLINESFEGYSRDGAQKMFRKYNMYGSDVIIKEWAPKDVSFPGVATLRVSQGSDFPCKVWFKYSPVPRKITPLETLNSDYDFCFQPSPTFFQKAQFTKSLVQQLDELSDEDYRHVMSALNLGENEQLTILTLSTTPETFDFTDGFNKFSSNYVQYSIARIFNNRNIKQKNITIESLPSESEDGLVVRLNISLYNSSYFSITIQSPLKGNAFRCRLVTSQSNTQVKAATVIFSNAERNTVSTQSLVTNPATIAGNLNFGVVRYSYEHEDKKSTNTDYSYYLNLGPTPSTLDGVDLPGGTPLNK